MGRKWNRGKDGQTDYFQYGEYRYSVMDTLGGYWFIQRRKIVEPNIRRFKTFVELHETLWGKMLVTLKNEDVEVSAYWLTRSKTNWANAGNEDIRTFDEDGRHFAVDLQSKEVWEYSKAEKISPDFRTVEELKKWADEFLKGNEGLF